MLTIKPVEPARTEVIQLIEQLDEYQSCLYPPESNHLDSIDALSKSNAFFLAAYTGSEICGIGSAKLIDDYGEIKRVFVPSNRERQGNRQSHYESIGKLSHQTGRCLCPP